MEKIVIALVALNEASNIKLMIEELTKKEFPKINADMSILVIDNHSTDGMTEIVENIAKVNNKVHIIQQQGKGLGWAYVSGFKYAMKELHADAVLEMDADFQHPPRFVKPMVDAYLAGADYCIGSRYVKGGSIPKEWAFSRKAVSYLGNLFIRLVLLKPSIHDLTTGFRLSRVKGVLDKIDLDNLMELNRFAYKVDLLYQCIKNSNKIVEVPLEFATREKDVSKFNPKEMLSTFKVAIILGIKDKQRFIKFGTVGFIGYLITAIGTELFSRSGITIFLASLFGFTVGSMFGFFAQASAWAVSIATEMAIISNFTLNNLWTFSEVKITDFFAIIKKFLQFNLSSLGAIVIQFSVIGIAVMLLGDTRTVRQVALFFSMPLVLSFNYVMYNIFIWKTWKIGGKK